MNPRVLLFAALVGPPLGAQSPPDSEPRCRVPFVPRSSLAFERGAGAGDVIEGTVITHNTGKPPEGAMVQVDELRIRVPVDANGRFRIANIPHGEYGVRVRAIGFHQAAARVTFAGNTKVEVKLAPAVHDPAVVCVAPTNIPKPIALPPRPPSGMAPRSPYDSTAWGRGVTQEPAE